MNRSQFFYAVKEYNIENRLFLYFDYFINEDDIPKNCSFLIGDINGINNNYHYYTSTNVYIKIYQFYKISGESMGSRVTDYLSKDYEYEHFKHKQNYISKFLSTRRCVELFWEDNKDWLSQINT